MDITLTIPNAQTQRVARIIGLQLGLKGVNGNPRGATPAEVKGWLIDKLRDVVRSYELNEAREQAMASVVDISVS